MKARVIYHNNGKRTYFIEDMEVSKEEFDATGNHHDHSKPIGIPMHGGNHPQCWPMKSDALAVHPNQIAATMARDRKHGIASEYDPVDGRCIIKDRGQRRELMKSYKLHDNEGGYGDDHHVSGPTSEPPADFSFLDTIE